MDAPNFKFVLLFCFLHHFGFAISSFNETDTIAINQIFQDGNLLISKDKNFALGFFSPGTSTYRYLGIWYHKLPLKTVLWVANRNHPINGSSGILSIDQFGNNLVLYTNPSLKVTVWSTNVSVQALNHTRCTAQILDSGNLILVQDETILWQSFDYPTDTLIQGMKLGFDLKTGIHRFLTAWKSPDDPATGDYSARVNPTGSPQVLFYKGTNYYWRSIPWPLRSYVDAINYSFVYTEDEIHLSYFVADTSAIVRAYLDYSGINRLQAWHEQQGKWNEFWSAPKYQCDSYGHCGNNGKCDPDQVNRRFECDCLPGFEPKNPRAWHSLRDGSGGCIRKRIESSSLCGNGEGFLKVPHVKLPDTSVAVWVDMDMSPIACEEECRRNCSCSAYASIDIVANGTRTGCLAWYGELMDTVNLVEEGYDLYVRVDAIELDAKTLKPKGLLGLKKVLVVSVGSTWLVVVCFAYLWLRKKRKRVNRKLLNAISGSSRNEVGDHRNRVDVVLFSLGALVAATNNFSPANRLGQGGFGIVYKGQLSNGLEVAVKKLSHGSGHGVEEFKNEVTLIAKLQHKNLVKLLGCCIEGEEPILIYEYMPNRSLDSFLFDETRKLCLDWRKRLDIIIGIARGILYLHHDSRLKIIHRDLKPSNILLDAALNPKISDFGMARMFEGDQIQERTKRIAGTYGYMSPEYVAFGKFSVKSDVFSYGVILLEIISGEKNNGFLQEDSLSLIDHVWQLWKEDRAMEIIDSSINESCSCDEVLRCIQIGLLCVQENAMHRPTMLDVVVMLNSNTTLPSPTQPAFSYRKVCSDFSSPRREGSCSKNELTITKFVGR
ncbi:G-type lectin S-receptor-like serine/threonine-protein kinase RKS1 [Euphorbia lathyris]|uniref:G-type lectin S-receptor-like serine/threonine-protein kinase RKS1 n=1 Tax=Euphorbia lathyris TaxID=212925 RepID=UPI003313BA09